MNLVVSVQNVRDYLQLEDNNPTGSSQYTDDTISSNILAAQSILEWATHRYLVDHPGITWTATTQLRAQLALPGFRAVTSVTWGATVLTPTGYWLAPDAMQTGLYMAIYFRPFRSQPGDAPAFLHYSNPSWFDLAADSPYFPPNYGGGWAYNSMPNDLVIVGDGGYAPGSEPFALQMAVKIYASYLTKLPGSILADLIMTAQGGVINVANMPPQVANFITAWKGGTSEVVSVG